MHNIAQGARLDEGDARGGIIAQWRLLLSRHGGASFRRKQLYSCRKPRVIKNTTTSSAAPTENGRIYAGERKKSESPIIGPMIRARAAADWLTPSTSPCLAGSLRRDTREWTDGFKKA